jgi:hypothetical protein
MSKNQADRMYRSLKLNIMHDWTALRGAGCPCVVFCTEKHK